MYEVIAQLNRIEQKLDLRVVLHRIEVKVDKLLAELADDKKIAEVSTAIEKSTSELSKAITEATPSA